MVFSKPRFNKITKLYSSITSSHSLYKNTHYFSINMDNLDTFDFLNKKLASSLENVYDNSLKLIIVDKEIKINTEYKIGQLFRNNFYRYNLSYSFFFKEGGIENFFLQNPSINQCIYMFKDIEYADIIGNFAVNKIIISGGSNTKKHMLSPIQLRLARFIIATVPLTGIEIAESFHNDILHNKSNQDWTSKEAQEKISNCTDEIKNKFMDRKLLNESISSED
jgi:hypothetical protein